MDASWLRVFSRCPSWASHGGRAAMWQTPIDGKRGEGVSQPRGRSAVAIACLLLGMMLPTPAQASSHTHLDCGSVLDVTLTPGLSLIPSQGSFTTGGERGTLDCEGVYRGRKVTGPGTLGIEGRYGESSPGGDSCLLEAGSGRYFFTLPTEGGPVKEQGTFQQRMFNRQGDVEASSADRQNNWMGEFVFIPTRGNCVSGPVTQARIEMDIRGGSAS